jgi:hypothetical protein
VRRGLAKDLANTPTQIACGWRLYGDLTRLTILDGQDITIDLLAGGVRVDGADIDQLEMATAAVSWMNERLALDDVPPGFVRSATLTLTPRVAAGRFHVHCRTDVETSETSFTSEDTATWHPGDASR